MTSCETVSKDRSLVLIDIRPFQERWGTMGWIPGSVHLPLADPSALTESDWDEYAAALNTLTQGRDTTVLVCLSGKRSKTALEKLAHRLDAPIEHLDSGMLGWAESYPICKQDAAHPIDDLLAQLESAKELKHAFTSCFVSEMVELSLETGRDDIDPVALLSACVRSANVNWDAPGPDDVRRVIERAGSIARRAGIPLERIAENTKRLLAATLLFEERAAKA